MADPLMKVAAERMKLLRKYHKMSQKALGERAGMHRSTIALYETGTVDPFIYRIKKIADVFGIKLSVLYDEDDKEGFFKRIEEELKDRK